MSSVIFEGWVYVLKNFLSKKKLFNSWKKQYFVLMRISNVPKMLFYNKKPKDFVEQATNVIDLSQNIFYVSRKAYYKGKCNICLLAFDSCDLYLVPKETKLTDIMIFLVHTLMKIKPEHEVQHFVVRLDKSRDLQRLGCQSSVCLLHLSNWGITLALQVSKSIIAQWPVRCIKSFECTGQGRLVITVGHLSSTGAGRFTFRTRIKQDAIIYETLDTLIDELARIDSYNPMSEMFNQSTISLRSPPIMNDLFGLGGLTELHIDCSFDQYHKKLAKDLCDYMSEHLGESVLALSESASVMNSSIRLPNAEIPSPHKNFTESSLRFQPSSSFKLSDAEGFIGCSADSGIGRELLKDSVFINSDNEDTTSCKKNNLVYKNIEHYPLSNSYDIHEDVLEEDEKEDKLTVDENDAGRRYIYMKASNSCNTKQSSSKNVRSETEENSSSSSIYTKPQPFLTDKCEIVYEKYMPGAYLSPINSKKKNNTGKYSSKISTSKKFVNKLRKNNSTTSDIYDDDGDDNDNKLSHEELQLDTLISVGDPSYLTHEEVNKMEPLAENLNKECCNEAVNVKVDSENGNCSDVSKNFEGLFAGGKLLKGFSLNDNTVVFCKGN
ncbi:hypothetical protein HELRODRAFT_160566 [Helobdella robusta]|uniref:IRS-type PTB domain-containing protein n=1 Tax=Helobdella robusta TaxID=6412 RepID=T1EQF4_HELRO|nr:hypothetical protein HELRODRAFT_160566 [Helobdella robusta]ESO06396.1 hypothetical protein HELRODRAFT_160566 [Helobdella robusta]